MSRVTRKTNKIFTTHIGAHVTLTSVGVEAMLHTREFQLSRFDLTMQQFVLVEWVQGFVAQPEMYFQYGVYPVSISEDSGVKLYVHSYEIQVVEPRPVVRRRLTVRARDV